jgi:hypothetical protein
MKFFNRLLLATCLCAFVCSTAEAAPVTLTITITGPNTGNVSARLLSGAPGGGLCVGSSMPMTPISCAITFETGQQVRVMANSPSAPGMLGDGSGDAGSCPAESTCNFFINTTSAITVTFSSAHPTKSIQVDFVGEGEISTDHNRCQNWELGASGCPSNYVTGSQVMLTGQQTPGSLFVSFSGGTANATFCTSSPCTFELFDDSTVDATFAALAAVKVDPPTPTTTIGGTPFFSATGTFTNTGTRVLQSGQGFWNNKRPMTEGRFSLAAGVIGDYLYAVGGIINDGDGPSTKLERYEPVVGPFGGSDRWNLNPQSFPLPVPTPLASLNVAREGLAAAVLGGKLYAIGGHTTGGGATAAVEAYTPAADPGAGSWATRASLSVARTWPAAAVIGTTLYVVGGGEQVDPDGLGPQIGPSDILESYDASLDIWTPLLPMPTARTGLAAAAVDGKLYAIGGFNGTNLAIVEVFDTVSGTWATRAPMPTPRTLLEAVAIDGLIYALGGTNGTNLNIVEVYNPATNTWTTLGAMPTPRSQFGLGALDGRLWAVGGHGAGSPAPKLASLEVLRPPENTWWSATPSVATINLNGNANALSLGTTVISARAVGISCLSSSCATLTVSDNNGPPPPPPPDDECARVTFTLLPGSLPFTEVQLTVLERSSGDTFGPFPVAIGEPQAVPAGRYQFSFSTAAGYRVTSAQRGLNLACGDDIAIKLRFHSGK